MMVTLKNNRGIDIQVNALKADIIQRVMNVAPQFVDIESIMLFGSATREDCREDSDIDLCFISSLVSEDTFLWSERMSKFWDEVKFGVQEVDFLDYASMSQLREYAEDYGVEQEILKANTVLYEKG